MKKKTAAKVGLASLAVMLGGGTILMNTRHIRRFMRKRRTKAM